MNTNEILLVGLGKLGLPLLSTFAKNGKKIIGFDIDSEKINILKNGNVPFYEKNLSEFLKKGYKNITYVNKLDNVFDRVDCAIILVNTPSNDSGEFSNKYVIDSIETICENLNKTEKEDFLFIISSTVMPCTHNDIINLIESRTKRKLNKNFGITYVPDLVALGQVIQDFENPDVIILGESSPKYGDIALKIYSKILKNNPPVVRMSLIEGEITKISLNAFITMKISFANFIGNVCEKFMSNPHNVTQALGHDKRISPYYLKSGLAFGGTCFPRDTWAFIKMSNNIGLEASHIIAAQKINQNQNEELYNKVKKYKNKTIGIFGLSFKPNTYVTTESPGQILYEKLINENYKVIFYDELITTNKNIDNFIKESDVIVITHPIKQMKGFCNVNDKIIINPWGNKLCTDTI
jgi:UDPglucose 6-dehydrogenase